MGTNWLEGGRELKLLKIAFWCEFIVVFELIHKQTIRCLDKGQRMMSDQRSSYSVFASKQGQSLLTPGRSR